MITLYVRCQTKDYILDIVAARAGMRINKVSSIYIFLFSILAFEVFKLYCGKLIGLQLQTPSKHCK